jgi:hypothetical protein
MLRRRRSGCEAPTDATPPCPLESISAQRRLVAAAYEQRAEVAPRAGRASYMLSLSRATKPTRCQTRSATPHAGSRGSRHRTGLVACGPHARTPKLSAKLQQSRNPSGSCSAAQSFRSIIASTHSPGPGLTWHAGGAQLGSPGRQRTRRRRPGISAAAHGTQVQWGLRSVWLRDGYFTMRQEMIGCWCAHQPRAGWGALARPGPLRTAACRRPPAARRRTGPGHSGSQLC